MVEPRKRSDDHGTFRAKPDSFDPLSEASVSSHQREHLLCLNQQEALMLFGLLQAACRHDATRRTLLSDGDFKHFHRQLSQSLAEGLASPGLG